MKKIVVLFNAQTTKIAFNFMMNQKNKCNS